MLKKAATVRIPRLNQKSTILIKKNV